MDIGILTSRGTVDRIVTKGVEVERQGFDFFGVGDTQNLFRELYVSLSAVATATETIDVGSVVTNPVTRHPAVTASAMASADELADGRVYMGLGSGDSAVRTLGKTPATLQEMKTLVETCRGLWRGESVEYDGESLSLRWLADGNDTHDIPIYLSAGGPKTLRLAGQVADAVFVAWGLTEEVVARAREHVAAGARNAGRDPADVDIYVWAKSTVADSREAARDELKMQLASTANHALRFDLSEKGVPEEYREPIRNLQREYEPQGHLGLDEENPNRKLVEKFGLTEYLADRFTVAGTVEDCIADLSEIGSLTGVDGVLFTADTEDQLGHIETLGEEILPQIDW